MDREQQVKKIKQLRNQYPQIDLQSAKHAIEDGYFILYCHPEDGKKFWSSKEAYDHFPLFGRQLKWEMVPYQKGIEMLQNEQ